jgi:peptidoglycan hydrolase CwlO-like protein
MAVTQQTPQLTLLPDPPLLTDDEDTYNVKADETVIAQQQMIPEINASLTWIGQQVTAVDGYRQAAAASAQTAAQQAAIATGAGDAAAEQVALAAQQVQLAATQVQAATAQANNAKASATAAESAPGSIGNLALMHATALSF